MGEYDFIKSPAKLKAVQVKAVTADILRQQHGKCPLCHEVIPSGGACLDHDHITGQVRGVLCRNCNGIEGRVFNRANTAKRKLTALEWIENLLTYWKLNRVPRFNLLYPTFKTEDEKRLARNAKARAARAAKKRDV